MRILMKRFLIGCLALLVALPVSGYLTWMLLPVWRWSEEFFGIEAVGHSGPADWCYLVTLGSVITAMFGIWILLRPKKSKSHGA